MGKNLKGKELGRGLYQRKDGRYEAKAVIQGRKIDLYDWNLKQLKMRFQKEKDKISVELKNRGDNRTLNQWFEEWFAIYKMPYLKESSVFPMKRKYENYFGKHLGEMKLRDVTNLDIQRVINKMHAEGRAASSIKDSLGRMRDCMEAAKNNLFISINPCFEVSIPVKEKQVSRRTLSRKEQDMFLATVEDNWYKEMFHIMFLTGLRVGEVSGLMWSDIDFKNRCIYVNRTLSCQYENGSKVIRVSEPKTYNSYRKIPFFGAAEQMLLSQFEKVKTLKKSLGKRWRTEKDYKDLVFVTSMGSPVFRYHAEKEVKKIVKEINLQEIVNAEIEKREPVIFEDMYPHAIRHTFCSRFFDAGMDPKVVQSIMGHQHYSTTIDIYTHVMDEKYEEAVEKFKVQYLNYI